MLSMKQAASRPRPPLPSAASGSHLRKSARSTPRSPSAASNIGQQPHIVQRVGEQPADQEFEREVIDPLARRRRSSASRPSASGARCGRAAPARRPCTSRAWSPCRHPCRSRAASLARIAPLISASASSSIGCRGAGKLVGSDDLAKSHPSLRPTKTYAPCRDPKPAAGRLVHCVAWNLCKDRADLRGLRALRFGDIVDREIRCRISGRIGP